MSAFLPFNSTPPLKKAILHIAPLLLALIVMAGCGGYARNYNEPKMLDGTLRARNLLSHEAQRQYDKLYLEAICQKLQGNTDAAHELLERALAVHPNASEALYELALMQLSLSPKSDSALVAQGEQMLQKAQQLEPSNPYICRTLAERWVRTGKYARASRLYETLIAHHPRSEDVSVLLRLYEVQKDYDNALKMTDLLETLEGEDESTALEKFRIYLEMGQTAQAYGTIEAISEAHPEELRYRVLLGDLYMQNGYKEKALGIYGDVLTTDPGNKLVKMAMLQYYASEQDTVRFHHDMTEIMLDPSIESTQKRTLLHGYAGEVLHGTPGFSKEGIFAHFKEALTLPQDDNSIAELCLAYAEATKIPIDSASFALESILTNEPENMDARLQLISADVHKLSKTEGKDTKTSQHLATVCHDGTVYHPDALIYYYYEGLALLQTEQKDDAIAAYERAIAIINDESDEQLASEIYASLGDLYHETGKKDEAYETYEKALNYNSEQVYVMNNYAYFLSVDGILLDKALNMSKKTIEAEPQNPTYLDTYAWILYKKHQYTQARIYIDQCIKNIPEDETAASRSASLYDHAGDIYYHTNDKKAALDFWKQALEITDDGELIEKLNKKIKNKRP